MTESLALDAIVAVWGQEFTSLPVKIKREIGLSLYPDVAAWTAAMDLAVKVDAGETQGVDETRALIREARSEIGDQITRARALLAKGWNAQAVAGQLRKDRLADQGTSLRGGREHKETSAISALWNMAQQRALTIAEGKEDVAELARLLLRQAAGEAE